MVGRFQFPDDPVEESRAPFISRSGPMAFAILVGAAVIAVTLIATPMISDKVLALTATSGARSPDQVVTGSIPGGEPMKRYTIRRSILQKTPNDVCIIPFGSNEVKC